MSEQKSMTKLLKFLLCWSTLPLCRVLADQMRQKKKTWDLEIKDKKFAQKRHREDISNI